MDPNRPRALDRATRAAGAALASALLILATGGELRAAPREVSLPELLALAERRAPVLRRARHEQARATAAMDAAGTFLHDDPTLSVGVGPRFGGGGQRGLDLQAALSQPVEVAGERGLRRAAAARYAERAHAERGRAWAELRRALTIGFHDAVARREQAALEARLRDFAERLRATAARRLEAGDATRIDLYLAEAELGQARQRQLAAESSYFVARVELGALSGWSEAEPPAVPRGFGEAAAPPPVAALRRRALGHHPELLLRQAAAREAGARQELAERQAAPRPSFGLELEREGSVGSPANHILLGTVELGLPLWSRNLAARGEARAERALAAHEVALAAELLEARLVQTHAEVASAAARVALLEQGASSALEESLSLLERGFEHGEFSALEVAAAEERFARAALAGLEARADYQRAKAELEYLVGGALEAPAAEAGAR